MRKNKSQSQNYILLPVADTQINTTSSSPKVTEFLRRLTTSAKQKAALKLEVRGTQKDKIDLKVLDSIQLNGAKLVQLNREDLTSFRFSYPGLAIIPEKFYRLALAERERIGIRVKQTQITTTISILVTNQENVPIEGIYVVVFTDYKNRKGASGITDIKGELKLKLNSTTAERIYVYADHSYWGYYTKNIKLKNEYTIKLNSIKLEFKDGLRHFYDTPNWPLITGKIRIGVIDTGIGPHRDLAVTGGKNLVAGENENDYHDNTEGHGTHVGGIIGAYGQIFGVASGVDLMSYRVFPKGRGASNFDIMKALNQAIDDKCHLINMSLGESEIDEGLITYIKKAYAAGIVCFAANGNDSRGEISFPACYSLSIAVSAIGTKHTFPKKSVQNTYIKSPYGNNENDFIAEFSNVGPETDLTAPGVGIISTYPNDLYAVMDGTSMSCPAATGLAARLLAGQPDIINMPATQERADEMIKFLAPYIKSMGFGVTFEGKGMLFDSDELHT